MRNEGPCLHCERQGERDDLELCPKCAEVESIRVLYLRRRGWTPRWEAHLRRLTLRARARLPLFEHTPCD